MKRTVDSVWFRKITASNLGALRGLNPGEYDLRLTSDPSIEQLVSNFPPIDPTPTGGWTKVIPLAPFDGPGPVAPDRSSLLLRFMGPGAQRSNDHYFRAQQPGSGYPLWEMGRAFNATDADQDLVDDLVIIAKDATGEFHARWVPKSEIGSLPVGLQSQIATSKSGVWTVPENTTTTPSPLVIDIVVALRSHHNVLLYGPPATGKTFLINQVRSSFGGGNVEIDTASERGALTEGQVHSSWATFHQSYSYEDFLVGLRPETSGQNGFSLRPTPGALLEVTEWARRAGNESLLIIDEINRGNVSKIFGEFITLIEPDKRLGPDGSISASTVQIRLPFIGPTDVLKVTFGDGDDALVPNPFTMPYAVYTLATMNSVDKSVAPLDAALRRRFHVIALHPDFSEFEAAMNAQPEGNLKDALELGIELLVALNQRVSLFMGSDYEFGQWYLGELLPSSPPNAPWETLVSIWTNTIFPQLQENFAGRVEQLLIVLGIDSSVGSIEVVKPSQAQEDAGAVPLVRTLTAATDQQIIELMRHIST